jgi:histidyl-tRNA synthetase
MAAAERLRDAVPRIRVELNLGGGSFKSQLKRADKSGAEFAVILGEDEVARGEAGLKPLRSGGEQQRVSLDKLTETLAARLVQEH